MSMPAGWVASLWVLFLVVVGAVVMVVAFSVIYRTTPPLGEYGQVSILNQETLRGDGFILVQVEKCSRARDSIGIVSMVSLQHTSDRDIIVPVGVTGQQIKTGCAETTTRYSFPSDAVIGGQWRVIGVDIVMGDRRLSQNVLWTSQAFLLQ